MLLVSLVLFGTVIAFNLFKGYMIQKIFKNLPVQSATVQTMTVKPADWYPVIHTVGCIQAIEGVMLKSEQGGRIVKIEARDNATVKKGDVLVSLDDALEQAALSEAKSHWVACHNNWNRAKALYQEKTISKQQYEEIESQYQALVFKIEGLEANIARRTIVAPFDGIIGLHTLSLGQYLSPHESVFRLDNIQVMRIQFSISQKDYLDIQVGLPLEAQFEAYPNQSFSGKIMAMDSTISDNGMLRVHAVIPNSSEQLKPGMFAKVKIKLPPKPNQFMIPLHAITFNLYGESVYVIEEKLDTKKETTYLSVRNQIIKTDGFDDQWVRVIKGLNAGDEFVHSGHMKLYPGIPIKVINKPSVPSL